MLDVWINVKDAIKDVEIVTSCFTGLNVQTHTLECFVKVTVKRES